MELLSIRAPKAQALAQHQGARFQLEISTHRDANGQGFPAIWIDGSLVKPSDGVIVMPEDIVAVLTNNDIAIGNDLHSALDEQIRILLHEGEERSC